MASNIARVVLGKSILLYDQWTLLIFVHFSIWWFEFGDMSTENRRGKHSDYGLTLRETNTALKIGHPKRRYYLPTIHFQGQAVSCRDGTSNMTSNTSLQRGEYLKSKGSQHTWWGACCAGLWSHSQCHAFVVAQVVDAFGYIHHEPPKTMKNYRFWPPQNQVIHHKNL